MALDLGPDTRAIDVLVIRTDCNGDVTPGRPEAAMCPSDDAVPAMVVLDAALGGPALVDGETGRERTPRAD